MFGRHLRSFVRQASGSAPERRLFRLDQRNEFTSVPQVWVSGLEDVRVAPKEILELHPGMCRLRLHAPSVSRCVPCAAETGHPAQERGLAEHLPEPAVDQAADQGGDARRRAEALAAEEDGPSPRRLHSLAAFHPRWLRARRPRAQDLVLHAARGAAGARHVHCAHHEAGAKRPARRGLVRQPPQ